MGRFHFIVPIEDTASVVAMSHGNRNNIKRVFPVFRVFRERERKRAQNDQHLKLFQQR